jgi:LPXTG-motif cell wall-anchored protein
MSRKFVVALFAAFVVVGAGATAQAQTPVIQPASQPAEPGASFSVTYVGCFPENMIVFNFQGQTVSILCDAPDEGPGTATAGFTAPEMPGTYTGTAAPQFARPQGFAGPRVPQGSVSCDPQALCASFTLTVAAPTTTTSTTTTTTTIAATSTTAPPTTLAPTTTLAVSGPVVTTTTAPPAVGPSLPATGPSQNDNTATIAIALLAAGGALIVASRWRRGSATH